MDAKPPIEMRLDLDCDLMKSRDDVISEVVALMESGMEQARDINWPLGESTKTVRVHIKIEQLSEDVGDLLLQDMKAAS